MKMEVSNSYLEDEVREGYFVPSIMKRAWAVELQVLEEVDKVCQRHGISWFAEWGTLLGAVRHRGYIPWDDDLDVVMLRKDYEHFLQVAHELPEGFKVLNIRSQPGFEYFLARVVAKPRICFEEEHLEKYNGFPYIAGIDIFVRDYIASDSQREEARITAAKYVLTVADSIGTPKIQGEELDHHLERIEEMCKIKIEPNQEEESLKTQLYQIVEGIFSSVNEEESLLITQMMPYGVEKQEARWMPKEWYADSVRMPFEHLSVPVPVAYDEVLRREYGEYMKPAKWRGGSHVYPFFHTQRKQLEEVLDFEIPGYRFSKEEAKRPKADRKGSLKEKAARIYEDLRNISLQIKENLTADHSRDGGGLLVDAQQLAIELGTMTDQVKGEGLTTVRFLEQYCETVYQIYCGLENQEDVGELQIKEMESLLQKIQDALQREVMDRKEIVFLSYKAKYWDAMEELYQKALGESAWDVHVISVPYYDKNYMGSFMEMHDEAEMLAEKVPVTNFHAFDFELHHPDCIVIQNPYDGCNPAVSVEKCCYSKNLQMFTECLIYIPYFTLDEFEKEDIAYNVMQYYCNMPGVVNADKVFVQSENMRGLYIEKLSEFAGEETRDIWEKKIYEINKWLIKDLNNIIEQ